MWVEQRGWIGVAAAVMVLGGISAAAQVNEQFLRTQRENALALREYQWKSRTELRRGGETGSVQLFLLRYGIDGNLQKTRLGGTPPPERPQRPLLRKMAENRTKEYQQMVADLGELAQSYANLPPEKMLALLEKANVITPLGRSADSVQIQVKNVLQRGDSVTIWIDSATQQQRRVEVQTVMNAQPVAIVSEFRRLPDGPTYAARIIVDYPTESVQLITDNFDYEL